MKINPKQLAAVIALSGNKRYDYFVKSVADWQQAWGLYQDGWALAVADDGTKIFPIWPAKEYAEVCIDNEWLGYQAKIIDLNDFLIELLPKLKRDRLLPGIFFIPGEKGVMPLIDQLKHDIEVELLNYQ